MIEKISDISLFTTTFKINIYRFSNKFRLGISNQKALINVLNNNSVNLYEFLYVENSRLLIYDKDSYLNLLNNVYLN